MHVVTTNDAPTSTAFAPAAALKTFSLVSPLRPRWLPDLNLRPASQTWMRADLNRMTHRVQSLGRALEILRHMPCSPDDKYAGGGGRAAPAGLAICAAQGTASASPVT